MVDDRVLACHSVTDVGLRSPSERGANKAIASVNVHHDHRHGTWWNVRVGGVDLDLDAGGGVGLDDLIGVRGARGLGDHHLVEAAEGEGNIDVGRHESVLGIGNELRKYVYEGTEVKLCPGPRGGSGDGESKANVR